MTRVHSLPIEAVVIGASAGGVQALLEILTGLPVSFSPPIVALLHMPHNGVQSRLAEVLGARLALPVSEARDKERLAGSHVYVAPSGYHLSIEVGDRSFSLSGEAPVHFSRPSIDVLMTSAADVYGPSLAGVLLTGASSDGAEGLARIGECGGFTVVQDPAQAQVATMPQAAIRRRAPDRVLALGQIRALLASWAQPSC